MTDAERLRELEESAEGVEFFRLLGEKLQVEKARDQAEASGWIPDSPSVNGRRYLLARVKARRNALHEAMVRLEACVAGAAQQDGWTGSVHAALLDLQSALDAHIREVELPDGLLTEVAEVAPRLTSDIERVRIEHDGLVSKCKDLLEALETNGATKADEISQKATRLLGRLAIHRQRGSRLLYDAYSLDVGGMG